MVPIDDINAKNLKVLSYGVGVNDFLHFSSTSSVRAVRRWGGCLVKSGVV